MRREAGAPRPPSPRPPAPCEPMVAAGGPSSDLPPAQRQGRAADATGRAGADAGAGEQQFASRNNKTAANHGANHAEAHQQQETQSSQSKAAQVKQQRQLQRALVLAQKYNYSPAKLAASKLGSKLGVVGASQSGVSIQGECFVVAAGEQLCSPQRPEPVHLLPPAGVRGARNKCLSRASALSRRANICSSRIGSLPRPIGGRSAADRFARHERSAQRHL